MVFQLDKSSSSTFVAIHLGGKLLSCDQSALLLDNLTSTLLREFLFFSRRRQLVEELFFLKKNHLVGLLQLCTQKNTNQLHKRGGLGEVVGDKDGGN